MTIFFRNHMSIIEMFICTILITFTSACTSTRTISVTDGEILSGQISMGEKIEVTQHDGDVTSFIVDEITDSGIGGDDSFIEYDDIEQVKVAQPASSINDPEGEWTTAFLGLMLGFAVAVLII